MATIVEVYGHINRFVCTLVAAELNAKAEWECKFCDSMRDQIEKYRHRMRITETQHQQLSRLSGE